jgi:hypothetical protein
LEVLKKGSSSFPIECDWLACRLTEASAGARMKRESALKTGYALLHAKYRCHNQSTNMHPDKKVNGGKLGSPARSFFSLIIRERHCLLAVLAVSIKRSQRIEVV